MKTTAISILILASMLLTACGAAETKTSDSAASGTEKTTEPPQTEAPEEPGPDLPEMDLGGETITVLFREAFRDEFDADTTTGEKLNDAVYEKNEALETQFNCVLDYIPNPSTDWGGGYQAVVSKSVLAGDEAYDIISGPSFHIPTLAYDGYLYNLNDLDYLDLDRIWWSQELEQTSSFGGNVYLVCGDISLGLIRYLHCTYFNKRIAQDLDLPDLYDLVLNGKWTVDAIETLSKGLYSDLNNNGASDVEEDAYGYLAGTYLLWRAYYDAVGADILVLDKDGKAMIAEDVTRAQDLADLLTRWVGTGSTNDIISNSSNDENYAAFSSGRALFTMGRFVDCETAYRDMKDDFGILPIPKWDEEQEEYRVTICGSESTFGVPVNSSKTDYIGAVLEAMAYESYKTVTPVYYESTLKVKYMRDDKVSKIIDIIHDGARFSPTLQLSKLTGMAPDKFITNAVQQEISFSTIWAESSSALAEKLEQLAEAMG